MKLTTTKKHIDAVPKKYIRVTITEETITKTVEKAGGVIQLSIGAGPHKKITPRTFRTLCRKIVRTARIQKCPYIAVEIQKSSFPQLTSTGEDWIMQAMVENFLIAEYEFTVYKTNTTKLSTIKEILICGGTNTKEAKGFHKGRIIGTYVNTCRDIANTTGGDMTPALLAREAKKAVRDTTATVKVLDTKAIQKLKMGLLLGVAQGSRIGPRFIVMEYWGLKKPEASSRKSKKTISKDDKKLRPIIFVGKGITFDTGGLSLKPSDGMVDMHLDMSGGAAVIAAVACAAKLKLKKNIIGLIPAAENAVSDKSTRPGDVHISMSGKTVDILNTDAEGRLVLADALTYAKRYNPRLVIDVATLTGAALVALGEHASAVLTKDDVLQEKLMGYGEESGDYIWPLPLWDEYTLYTKGRFGDVANIQTSGNPRYGGTINGAMFLSHFSEDYPKDCPWAHIDMAPRMTAALGDELAKGATGEPVRLLVKVAENY